MIFKLTDKKCKCVIRGGRSILKQLKAYLQSFFCRDSFLVWESNNGVRFHSHIKYHILNALKKAASIFTKNVLSR